MQQDVILQLGLNVNLISLHKKTRYDITKIIYSKSAVFNLTHTSHLNLIKVKDRVEDRVLEVDSAFERHGWRGEAGH